MELSKRLLHIFLVSFTVVGSTLFYCNLTSREAIPLRGVVEEPQLTQQIKGALVFDLGGVLLKTDESAAMKHLGKGPILSYIKDHWKTPVGILPLLYEILNEGVERPNETLKDPYGNILPHLFSEVLKGNLNEQECLKIAHDIIHDDNNLTKFHKNPSKARNSRAIASRIAQLLFDPEVFAKTQKLHPHGSKLLRACQNSDKCEILIFSNFSKQAFVKMQEKYPDLFAGIKKENIIVSGEVGHAKPDPGMYQILLKRLTALGVKADQTYFVDDQLENTQGANAFGINGIHCKDPRKAHRMLCKEGVI